jgi:hypothetical protein
MIASVVLRGVGRGLFSDFDGCCCCASATRQASQKPGVKHGVEKQTSQANGTLPMIGTLTGAPRLPTL